jgi:hypothetical protein
MTAAERQQLRRERQEADANAAVSAAYKARHAESATRRTREQVRLDKFEDGLALSLHAIESAASMDIPSLSAERGRLAELQMRAAARHLALLRSRIRESAT